MEAVMSLVHKTLGFIISQMGSTDRLAIILYDDQVETVCSLVAMDRAGKELATSCIPQIVARGSTDLCAGLMQGIETMQNVHFFFLFIFF
jgi:hypothetical protein